MFLFFLPVGRVRSENEDLAEMAGRTSHATEEAGGRVQASVCQQTRQTATGKG